MDQRITNSGHHIDRAAIALVAHRTSWTGAATRVVPLSP
jgi:hypothetical protein